MVVYSVWMTLLTIGLGVTNGKASSESEKCVVKVNRDSEVFKPQYCLMTRRDIKLSCPKNKIVVLSSLNLAVKKTMDVCTQRILNPDNEFCCILQDKDVLFDGKCLQGVWNPEDRTHYQSFLTEALRRCTGTSKCVLDSNMFTNLQRKIPGTKEYSSYFQVTHRCITDPVKPIYLCSHRSSNRKEIYLKDNFSSGSHPNKTCTCRVTSQGGNDVTVSAVDLRIAQPGLVLSSGKETKDMSHSQLPIFGFQRIITGRKINISLKLGPPNKSDSIWLHISGSNGKNVTVECGETQTQTKSTVITRDRVSTVTENTGVLVYWGYWPLVYIAAGSIFTIVIVACILGSVLLCKHSKKRDCRHHHPYGDPSFPSPADFHQDHYSPPYACVLDDHGAMAGPPEVISMSGHLPPGHGPEASYVRNVLPPDAPPPLPPNGPGKRYSSSPSCRHLTLQGKESNVSQLEAFLKC